MLTDANARNGTTIPRDRLMLDVSEVQQLLGVSRTAVYELLRSGELKRAKIGKRTKIPRANVEAFAARVAGEQGVS